MYRHFLFILSGTRSSGLAAMVAAGPLRRTAAVLCVLAGFCLSPAAVPAGITGGAEIGQEVFFTLPGPTGEEEDHALEKKLLELLEMAEPGSEVHGSIFTFSRTGMARAFIEAHRRGVEVRLLAGSEFRAVRRLKKALPKDHVLLNRNAEGEPGGFHSDGINHNKFFLFSRLSDGSEKVVVQSSANLTRHQLRTSNNMVIIRNDAGLYDAYLAYWQDMSRRVQEPDYYRFADGDSGARVYFFPRDAARGAGGEKDTVVEILDEIDPRAGGEIHVAMAYFTGGRPAVAHKLVELQEEGMMVRAIAAPKNLGHRIARILETGGVELVRMHRVHSKYVLIDGRIGGRRVKQVLTGSHNFTGPALTRNDETLLRLDDPQLYNAYLSNWNDLREHPLSDPPAAAIN